MFESYISEVYVYSLNLSSVPSTFAHVLLFAKMVFSENLSSCRTKFQRQFDSGDNVLKTGRFLRNCLSVSMR